MASDSSDRLPKPEIQKTIVIMDGGKVYYAGFADKAQVKKILDILLEQRHRLAQ